MEPEPIVLSTKPGFLLKCLKCYVASLALVLTVTSLAKLYSATGTARVLDIPESLLPLTYRHALVSIGLVELLIALYLWGGRTEVIKLICIAWLGGNFLLYRIATVLLVVARPCPCLGSITERLPLKAGTINWVLTLIVWYMVLGSVFFLVNRWIKAKNAVNGITPENPERAEVVA